jgi:hypothetical protein
MQVQDPLYGRFELPPRLARIALAPEVRRLSQIRLLNTLSPSLATLGELRRYSHTLGVLHLCLSSKHGEFSEDEAIALAASVLLHDIGTPPFGHLMEYHLREATNFHHESVIDSILWGRHVPENTAHQLFGGRPPEIRKRLREESIPLHYVEAIVNRKHPLSALLFGSIDLDNLDNVTRMAWALGLKFDPTVTLELAKGLSVSRAGELQLGELRFRGHLDAWAAIRRRIYEILIFDPLTVATQAVLSEAIELAFRFEIITEPDWSLYDELLLDRLQKHPTTKQLIVKDYLGEPPNLIFALQLAGSFEEYGLQRRQDLQVVIAGALKETFGKAKTFSYALVERGSFEKKLQFYDPDTGQPWHFGHTSESIVAYGFLRSSYRLSADRARSAAKKLLSALKADPNRVLKLRISGNSAEEGDEKSQLTLEAV